MNKIDLLFDKKHIWHPYESITGESNCFLVTSAKGIFLKLSNGKKIIDGMSSWWSAIHGYNNKKLNNALYTQIKKMSHVMFGGITHKPAILLCRQLLKITPKNLDCIFLADSGSVAIEIAIKMILQYWSSLKINKKKFLTIKNSYHGDTFFATSVSDPINSCHKIYNNIIPKNIFAESPTLSFNDIWNDIDFKSFKDLIYKNQNKIAGVILEPIVQGAGGMKFYHPNYLKNVRKLCNLYKIPLIIDEIATGFGRTGKLFASEHANISGDILCIGKALTAGTLTLSAVLTTRHIADVISNGKSKCFMHGPTYMGNPLACAVANENIKILKKNKWKNKVKKIERELKKNLKNLSNHPKVSNIRVLGAIGVVECIYPIKIKEMQNFFVKNNIWLKPFRNLIYTTPAYIIDKDSLKKITQVIALSLDTENFIYNNKNLTF
ncbi:adenosylmethionine--8-amino-7-oxononanoate transaminase [Buchnera aphidicola]|uniref:adenosylmethionine--8-amino-7-oxononanoate transaminase n=1 Tax=Buchnera aphidicola TaxID=9 RepID=UPI002237FF27|nr:adenosylmethionine--8-amino-7-oxononanoate transaminase [Buchnera aphidicola]MCW5197696.1 adenosylmethionine--8-amino-7-oxononanoate transaminase [Buchnera aphidicola (Chaitophorus viminalis)]